MKTRDWLQALTKACKMMSHDPRNSVAVAYFWRVYNLRPEDVSKFGFCSLVSGEQRTNWNAVYRRSSGLEWCIEWVEIDVWPARQEDPSEFSRKVNALIGFLPPTTPAQTPAKK